MDGLSSFLCTTLLFFFSHDTEKDVDQYLFFPAESRLKKTSGVDVKNEFGSPVCCKGLDTKTPLFSLLSKAPKPGQESSNSTL
jgi:hypothetical protein